MNLSEAALTLGLDPAALPLDSGVLEQAIAGFSIDSRTIREGELFIAIRGERVDGHQYVADAIAKGAIAALVESGCASGVMKTGASETARAASEGGRALQPGGATAVEARPGVEPRLIEVPDTLVALQTLASRLLSSWKGLEVAITGSSGKTTTKELISDLLAGVGKTHRSAGNLNNEYGLPLSVLKMESEGRRAQDFDYAVFEMGMNHPGEISRLTQIAPPHIGVVTNVGAVHLEFFDSVDAIAGAKAELIRGLKPGGTAILNADDDRVAAMRKLRSDIQTLSFGIDRAADIRATDIEDAGIQGSRWVLISPHGSAKITLPLPGRHSIYNALAAAAAGDFCGVSVEMMADRFANSAAPGMRGQLLRFVDGFQVIDDSYNSNPAALDALVAALQSSPAQRRIVVAGEMLELGGEGPQFHRSAGRRISERGIDILIGVRGLAQAMVDAAQADGMTKERALFTDTPEQAADALADLVREGDLVLIKGSRGVRTEVVVNALKNRFDLVEKKRES